MTQLYEHESFEAITAEYPGMPEGFDKRPAILSPEEQALHADVLAEALSSAEVQVVLTAFDDEGDLATKDHSLRVAWRAAAGAIRYNSLHDGTIDRQDVLTLTRAAIGHDIGKLAKHIQEAIADPEPFDNKPELRQAVREHPAWTVLYLEAYNFSPNEVIIGAKHHAFQTLQDPYDDHGVLDGEPTFAAQPELDKDGNEYLPPVELLTQILAVADNWDALTTHHERSGRMYQKAIVTGPEKARHVISTLNMPEAVRELVAAIGYAEYPTAALSSLALASLE